MNGDGVKRVGGREDLPNFHLAMRLCNPKTRLRENAGEPTMSMQRNVIHNASLTQTQARCALLPLVKYSCFLHFTGDKLSFFM